MSQDTARRPWGWAYVHSPLTASVCIGERCPADMQGLPNVKPVFLEQQASAAQDAAATVPWSQSDADAWAERHGLNIHGGALFSAFEDAATLYLTRAATLPAPQAALTASAAVPSHQATAAVISLGSALHRISTGNYDGAAKVIARVREMFSAAAPTAAQPVADIPAMPPYTPEQRAAACVAACKGLPDHALYGGWTAAGLSRYAKSLEDTQAAPDAVVPLTTALINQMVSDTKEVFEAKGPETPQVVRDVIEYMSSWLSVYAHKRADQMSGARGAQC